MIPDANELPTADLPLAIWVEKEALVSRLSDAAHRIAEYTVDEGRTDREREVAVALLARTNNFLLWVSNMFESGDDVPVSLFCEADDKNESDNTSVDFRLHVDVVRADLSDYMERQADGSHRIVPDREFWIDDEGNEHPVT